MNPALRLLLALLLLAAPARAEMPAGADDPAFEAAVEVWLANNDADALPELARLAGGENIAAQILLGRIAEKHVVTQGWRKSVGINGYRDIFYPRRQDFETWLALAAEHSLLARAFQEARFDEHNIPRTVEGVANLLSAGEERAVSVTVIRLWISAHWDELVRLMAEDGLPRHLRYYAWLAALKSDLPEAEALRADMVAAARSSMVEDLIVGRIHQLAANTIHRFPDDAWGPQVTQADLEWWSRSYWFTDGEHTWLKLASVALLRLPLEDRAPDAMIDEMMAVPELLQIVHACAALCPESRRACVRAAHSYSGGYRGIVKLGSPTETLIPQPRYVRSPRARWELLHHIVRRPQQTKMKEPGALAAVIAKQDQCLAAHVRTYGVLEMREAE